jgi:uracil-DNA glycosylase family 4
MRQGFGARLIDIGNSDLSAGGVQGPAGGRADSARAARNQGMAPVHTKRKMHRLNSNALQVLQDEIIQCRRCPRLVEHREAMAQVKRRAYLEWDYWGKPVPSFGPPGARLLIIGLAPGAHGSNRTGRMFTGDMSGNILYRVLYETGFARQAESVSRFDGQQLTDACITAIAHCAPPGNKPTREEIANCRPYLERELDLLQNVRVVVALGRMAFDNYLGILRSRGLIRSRADFVFGHGSVFEIMPGQPVLISSYHPSQQNTSTGKLTEEMLLAVFSRARKILGKLS